LYNQPVAISFFSLEGEWVISMAVDPLRDSDDDEDCNLAEDAAGAEEESGGEEDAGGAEDDGVGDEELASFPS
jgi:hypothetical protein